MNIAKNMEIIFVAAASLAIGTSFASAANAREALLAPVAIVAPAAKVVVADANMQVVVVSAKRLTAAEKAAL